jgi:hypothetical protein
MDAGACLPPARTPGRSWKATPTSSLASPFSVATHDEVLRRARIALQHGESVVLDASWTDHGMRDVAAELSRTTSSDLVELRCDAPLAVARAMAAMVDPWPEAVVVATWGAPGALRGARGGVYVPGVRVCRAR